jgi:hypothetical protein
VRECRSWRERGRAVAMDERTIVEMMTEKFILCGDIRRGNVCDRGGRDEFGEIGSAMFD